MLSDRLHHKLNAEEISELHQRAQRWYSEHGFFMEAISHALYALDYDTAADYMEHHLSAIIKNGDESLLLKWLESLPLASIIRRTDLFYFQAGRMAASGLIQEAKSLLSRTMQLLALEEGENVFPEDTRGEIEMRMGFYQASIAFYQGDIDTFVDLIDANMEGLERFGSIVKVVNLGEALLYRGPIGFGGRLKQMAYLSAKVSTTERRRQALHQALQGHGYVFLADLYYEWNRIDEAQIILQQALAVHDSVQSLGVITPATILLSKIYEARGEWAEAERTLHQAIQDMESFQSPHWQLLLEARLVRVRLSQGDVKEGKAWLEHRHIQATDKTSIAREYENCTLARVLIGQNQTVEAIVLLKKLLVDARRADRMGSSIEMLLLLALAYQDDNRLEKAMESLVEACRLAEPAGYVRIFLDEGQPLAKLIARSSQQASTHFDTSLAYATGLLPLFEEGKLADGSDVDARTGMGKTELHSGTPISLTSRELEILRCIANGQSNNNIALSLYISPGTVKRYIYNLYQKLEVKNRVQAVSKATELGLL